MTRRSRILVPTIAFFTSLALQASFPPFAAPAGPPLKGFATFKVVDANGKELGIAIPRGDSATLVFNVGGQVFSVYVQRDGFQQSAAMLLFESPDTTCSGTPLIRVGPAVLLTEGVIGPPGSTIYAPDPQAVPQTITVGSFLFLGCDTFGTPFNPGPVVPAVALVDLDTQFTPPFTIKP